MENQPNYYDVFIKSLKNELSVDSNFKIGSNNGSNDLINKFDNKYKLIIDQNKKISELFNKKCDLFIENNEIFLISIVNKECLLSLKNEDKKINLNFINLNNINSTQFDIDLFINDNFEYNQDNIYEKTKIFGEYFQKLIYKSIINKIKNNFLITKYLSNFLNKYENLNINDIANISLDQFYFLENKLDPIIKKIFKNDTNNKFITDFKKFNINSSLQKELNEIYNFNYSKNWQRIFQYSEDEINLENLENCINNFNYDNADTQEKINFKRKIQSYNFIWINPDFLRSEILNKLSDDINNSLETIREDNFKIANEIRLKIENYLKLNNKKINDINDQKILEIKKYTNRFHHNNPETREKDFQKLKEYNRNLNEHSKYVQMNLK